MVIFMSIVISTPNPEPAGEVKHPFLFETSMYLETRFRLFEPLAKALQHEKRTQRPQSE